MRRIHLPDPLFEQRLEESGGGGVLGALPAGIAERVEDLSLLSGLLAGVGDVVLVDCCLRECELPELLRGVRFLSESVFCDWFGGLTVGERQGWRLEPWGWSEYAVGLVKRLGLSQGVPDPAVVRLVNSREFSAVEDVLLGAGVGGEQRVSVGPWGGQFGRLCRSEGDVLESLEALSGCHAGGWVLKSNFSHAARNRLVGRGESLSERERGWLLRRLQRVGCVYVEPWVERLGECGLQWEVHERAGGGYEVEFVGASEFLADAGGEYRGSVLRGGVWDVAGGEWWGRSGSGVGGMGGVWGVSRGVVERAGALGFRGPLGIDCMRIRYGGVECVRPVHDVNGRQTMGRVALGLRRLLGEGEWGAWLHFPAESAAVRLISRVGGSWRGVRVHATGAELVNARAARLRSWLVIAEDSGVLQGVLGELGCVWSGEQSLSWCVDPCAGGGCE